MGTKFTAQDRIMVSKWNPSLAYSSWLTTPKDFWESTQEQLGVLEVSIKGVSDNWGFGVKWAY